jgi:hypothetical protein
MTTVDASKLINFDNKFAYYATELGLEPGEYDYVSRDGLLLDRDFFETAAEEALNRKYADVRLLGKTLKVSDIAKELCPDEWEAYVDESINMPRLLKLVRPII